VYQVWSAVRLRAGSEIRCGSAPVGGWREHRGLASVGVLAEFM